jgi:hypothetical protein
MFDHSEEDKDTENQVSKGTSDTSDMDSKRSEREGTPGPQVADETKIASHIVHSPGSSTTIQPVAEKSS